MPVYVYECPEGHTMEIEESIGKAPDHPKCPECRKRASRSYKGLNISGKVEGGTNGGTKIGR